MTALISYNETNRSDKKNQQALKILLDYRRGNGYNQRQESFDQFPERPAG
jgi:hypothetical protein